jgi:hypothetical protein
MSCRKKTGGTVVMSELSVSNNPVVDELRKVLHQQEITNKILFKILEEQKDLRREMNNKWQV